MGAAAAPAGAGSIQAGVLPLTIRGERVTYSNWNDGL